MKSFYLFKNKNLIIKLILIFFISPAKLSAQTLESLSMIPDKIAHYSLTTEHWINANGVRVYYVNAPTLPMLDIKIIFNAGSARDSDKPGTALLTNAMLDEGTDLLSADAIADQFDNAGAQFNSQSIRDMAFLDLRTLSDEKTLSKVLPLMSSIIQSPSFPQTSLTRIKNQILSSLVRQQQLPQAIAKKAFFPAIYGNHPYGSPVDGNEKSINSITRHDLLNFYHQYYVGKNAVVALVGNVDRKTAEHISVQLTGSLPTGNVATTLPTPAELQKNQSTHIEFNATQTHILMGGPSITRNDSDYVALYVANHIFGGGGFGSILTEEIREKRGLAYVASSDLTAMNAQGPFIINLQTRNDQADEALTITKKSLGDFVKNGPTEDQLKKAKMQIMGEFPLSISDNASIANYIASAGFYNLPPDYYDTFLKQVDALTIEQVKDALQKHIHPDSLVTITVGKQSENKK